MSRRSSVVRETPVIGAKGNYAARLGLTAESFRQANSDNLKGDVSDHLQKQLKPRHVHMIAIGGAVGTGLFVGTGGALASGGPGSVLLCFLVVGAMLFNVLYALGELSVMYPVVGGTYIYSSRFIDSAWGFAAGWNYMILWIMVLPLELTAAGLTMSYWDFDISVGVWITVFYFLIIFFSTFGVWMYGEEEFWASIFKIAAVVVFIITGVVLNCGGGPRGSPYDSYVGGRYWREPGAFVNGFQGLSSVFATAAFSFAGSELVGLAAAETPNPRETIPRAIKQVFWRICIFYITSLLLIGLLVPYNHPRLLGSYQTDISASPFVIALENGRLHGFPTFFNIVILISVVSVGFTCVFAGSRTLTALAEQKYAPRAFKVIDRVGRPTWATIFCLSSGPIAYMNLSAKGAHVFNWILSAAALSTLMTWASISIAHIRFRRAWKAQGHSLDEIPFKAVFGVPGSYFALVIILVAMFAQAYTCLVPVNGVRDLRQFYASFAEIPVFIVLFIGAKLWERKRGGTWLALKDVDLHSGRRLFSRDVGKKEQSWSRSVFDILC